MTEPNPQPSVSTPKVIKRYTNRKLYDTAESRYITLDEIADMVKQGVEVSIVDNKTKEDLTSVTLAQIVFEEEKKKSQTSLTVLREMIQRPSDTLTEFFKSEVSPRVASIREEAESRLDKLLRRDHESAPASTSDVSAPEEEAQAKEDSAKAAARSPEESPKRFDERVKAAVESVMQSLPSRGPDLAMLLQRIEQLEKRIQKLEQEDK